MAATRTADFTIYIVRDPKAGDVWEFRSEDDAYAMWLEVDGAQCDAYNAAEKWSMPMDAQFNDYRDEEQAQAVLVARHHERLGREVRVA